LAGIEGDPIASLPSLEEEPLNEEEELLLPTVLLEVPPEMSWLQCNSERTQLPQRSKEPSRQSMLKGERQVPVQL
jgi:hypothetical protein